MYTTWLFLLMKINIFVITNSAIMHNNYPKSTNDSDQSFNKIFVKDINSIGLNIQNFAVDVLSHLLEDENNNSFEEPTTTTTTTTILEEETTESTLFTTEELPTTFPRKLSRRKRTVNDNSNNNFNSPTNNAKPRNTEGINVRPSFTVAAPATRQDCIRKSDYEEKLEQQHIKDLRDEIVNLRDLVMLLRDQQQIIKLLQNETKQSEKDLSRTTDNSELFKMLDDNNINSKPVINNVPTHEELKEIKINLRNIISTLNNTQQILAAEKLKDAQLEHELNNQKSEINLLKLIVEKILKNHTQNETSNNEIVGSPAVKKFSIEPFKFQPPPPPHVNNMQSSKLRENINDNNHHPNGRASESSELAKILNRLSKSEQKKPNLSELKTKLQDLEDEISRQQKDDNLAKELELLQKLSKVDNTESKSLDDSDDELMKRLEKAMQKLDGRPQSKSDVNSELEKLQNAIERLRPKDDGFNLLDGENRNEQERFQTMLQELINNQNGVVRPQIPQINSGVTANAFSQMTPQQIVQIKKQMGQGSPTNYNQFGGGFLSNGFYPSGNYLDYPSAPYFGPYASQNYAQSYALNRPDGYKGNYGQNLYGSTTNYGGSNINQYNPGYNKYNTPQYSGSIFQGPSNYNQGSSNYNPGSSSSLNNYQPSSNYNQGTSSYNNQGSSNYNQNQFFPGYGKTTSDNYAANSNSYGQNSEKYNNYPQGNTETDKSYTNQQISDLKTQIDGLQTIINNLNKPDYYQNAEDKQTVYNLEKQIYDLKNVISTLNTDGTDYSNTNYPTKEVSVTPASTSYDQNSNVNPAPYSAPAQYTAKKAKRSIDDNTVGDGEIRQFVNNLFTNEDNSNIRENNNFDNLRSRITNLRKQLETNNHRGHPPAALNQFQRSQSPSLLDVLHSYQTPSNYQQYNAQPYSVQPFIQPEDKKVKSNDHFTRILLKIIDKVLDAAPEVFQKLFGFAFKQISAIDTSYGSGGYDYSEFGELQKLLGSIGFLGHIPLILLRLIEIGSAVSKVLKKNTFFKTFLIPGINILVILGHVVFLIWFLQPDNNEKYYDNNYDQHKYIDGDNYYYDRSAKLNHDKFVSRRGWETSPYNNQYDNLEDNPYFTSRNVANFDNDNNRMRSYSEPSNNIFLSRNLVPDNAGIRSYSDPSVMLNNIFPSTNRNQVNTDNVGIRSYSDPSIITNQFPIRNTLRLNDDNSYYDPKMNKEFPVVTNLNLKNIQTKPNYDIFPSRSIYPKNDHSKTSSAVNLIKKFNIH